ncbi:KH domain-containing protein [Candidatus Peregrinibacteria bacterium]|nr:KH domain-containing protein [Candidatus Peregrinibacteria bacterium]
MEIEDILKETLEEVLEKIGVEYSKITITEEEKDNFFINIQSDNPSLLIGYHGDNIQALQHLLKTLSWKKAKNEQFNILLDVDNYRKRQEENALAIAERKIEGVRKMGRPQSLPPMSPYLRRKVHLMCMGAGFDDIETISEGTGNRRHIIIKLKS